MHMRLVIRHPSIEYLASRGLAYRFRTGVCRNCVGRAGLVRCLSALLTLFAMSAPGLVRGQSSPAEIGIDPDTRTPNGALYRSFVPGWGQIYNGHYGKLPFVLGGLFGFGYLAVELNNNYQDYNDAFHFKVYQEQVDAGIIETNPNEHLKEAFDRVSLDVGPVSSSPLRAERNRYRRNRDLSRLGIIAVYGLSILDAYVSAHLLDFNVDENLSLQMTPVVTGVSARITYRIW